MKDALLLIEGKVRFDEFANTWVLRATKVSELERLREKEARRIVLKRVKNTRRLSLDRLQAAARRQYKGGNCHVALQFMGQGARGTFSLRRRVERAARAGARSRNWRTLLGRGRIAVLYSPPPVAPARRPTADGKCNGVDPPYLRRWLVWGYPLPAPLWQ